MEKAVIGLDIGTSSIKAVLFNKEKRIISLKKIKFNLIDNNSRLDMLFDKVKNILIELKNDNPNIEINAIGISTIFPSLIPVDINGNALTSLLGWNNNLAHSIITEFKRNNKEVLELCYKTGCPIHESYSIWKMLWLKKNNPIIFNKTYKFISLSEYIIYKLTGKFIVSYPIASTTGLFNIHNFDWDHSILGMIGISSEQLSSCKDIFHSEKIKDEIAIEIGLNNQLKIIIGAGDGMLCHVGCGGTKKSMMSSTLGTSGALRFLSDKKTNNPLIWCHPLFDNKFICGVAINAGGITTNWFINNFTKKNEKELLEELGDMEINSDIDGPIFLPFLNGERGPNYNQNMNASMVGLKSSDDEVSIYRSIIEGIFFNLYQGYEKIVEENGKPLQIIASGGYTKSDYKLQMQADIFNEKIIVPEIVESTAVGTAIIALKSIKELSNISEVNPKIKKVFYPNKERHNKFKVRYEIFKKFYEKSSGKIN